LADLPSGLTGRVASVALGLGVGRGHSLAFLALVALGVLFGRGEGGLGLDVCGERGGGGFALGGLFLSAQFAHIGELGCPLLGPVDRLGRGLRGLGFEFVQQALTGGGGGLLTVCKTVVQLGQNEILSVGGIR